MTIHGTTDDPAARPESSEDAIRRAASLMEANAASVVPRAQVWATIAVARAIRETAPNPLDVPE